jgi:hypothetical protein
LGAVLQQTLSTKDVFSKKRNKLRLVLGRDEKEIESLNPGLGVIAA